MGFCPVCGEIVPAGKSCRRCGVESAQPSEGARVSDSVDGHKTYISDRFVHGAILEGDIETGIARVLNLNDAGQHAVDELTKQSQVVGYCSGCGKKVNADDSLSVKGKCWHKNCFNQEFKCKSCSKPLFGAVVEACDGCWHNECFKCCKCNCLIGDKPHSNLKGWPICDECAEKLRAEQRKEKEEYERKEADAQAAEERNRERQKMLTPNCAKCGEPIKGGQGVEVDDQVWHAGCFKCTGCSKVLGQIEFVLVGNKPYCGRECAATAQGKICHACSKPMTGQYVVVGGFKYHKECFVCSTCKGPLSGGYCEVNGKHVCQSCADKASTPTVTYTTRAEGRTGGFIIDPLTGKKRTVN